MAEMGSAPTRNLDYYLQRMSGYSKNTIKLQPQSKLTYNAGDTVVFRLPTNSILDLHTLTLKFSAAMASNLTTAPPSGGDANPAAAVTRIANNTATASYPQNTSSFIRRNDWTMGGMQVGLGSLHDYGFLYSLLAKQKQPNYRSEFDLDVTDSAGILIPSSGATVGSRSATLDLTNQPAIIGHTQYIPPNGGFGANNQAVYPTTGGQGSITNPTKWTPLSISNWLGIASGTYMRFLDTNM